MSHWLHCNGCYCQPDAVELRFYITNCSHIYCEKCVTPCTKERCKVCRSQCTTLMLGGKATMSPREKLTIEYSLQNPLIWHADNVFGPSDMENSNSFSSMIILSQKDHGFFELNEIPKEVESLFCDPMDLHQKMTKQFYQTLEFQKSHQRRLLRRFKEKLKTFELQINEVRDVIMQARAMEREFIKLKAENEYLKLLLSKKDGHPRPTSRAGVSPSSFSYSPGQGLQFSRSQNTGSAQQQKSMRGMSSILTQPGRLLMRTPPSDGHLGTVAGSSSYTPSSIDSKSVSLTPISVPRPIHLHKSE